MSAERTRLEKAASPVDDGSTGRGDQQPRAADRLVLDAALSSQIISHLRSELPNEGVGLLAARLAVDGDSVTAIATRFFPGRNQRASPTRFDLDLRDLVHALAAMEEGEEVLGGIVHSHPRGAPVPSVTDLAEAHYPESLMIIVSFATATPWLRAWRLTGEPGAWHPIEVPISESS